MNFAVFDLETNGMKGSSVVSTSSIIFDDRGQILDFFNRFYYPTEKPDPATERIHGLTIDRIYWFRQTGSYPPYFLDDLLSLYSFWERWHITGVVVHNLAFDTSFLPPETVRKWKWWCSMLGLTNWCAIPNPKNSSFFKWPRLNEAKIKAVAHLKTPALLKEMEEKLPKEMGHYSLSDCFELYGIFTRVWASCPELVSFRHYRNRYYAPKKEDYVTPSPLTPDPFVIKGLLFAQALAHVCHQAEYGTELKKIIEHYEGLNMPL